MTAAGSIGFLGVIRYRTAFIIGLCTLAAYWFDDLVDLTRDETRVPIVRPVRPLRVVLLLFGLSMVTLCLLWLLPSESRQLLVLLAFLAMLAIAFVSAMPSRRSPCAVPSPTGPRHSAGAWPVFCLPNSLRVPQRTSRRGSRWDISCS